MVWTRNRNALIAEYEPRGWKLVETYRKRADLWVRFVCVGLVRP